MAAASDLFRRDGYVATSVDNICAAAGLTKGAFFHHFESKESLAETCLQAWDGMAESLEQQALETTAGADPRDPFERLSRVMEFFIGVFESPQVVKSCLAGTTVQEVSESNPRLREAANRCFVNAQARFAVLLEAAAGSRGVRIDAASLASLWMGAMQGALILHKASRDERVISDTLRHVKRYIEMVLAGNARSEQG